jgi:hypothetical protein
MLIEWLIHIKYLLRQDLVAHTRQFWLSDGVVSVVIGLGEWRNILQYTHTHTHTYIHILISTYSHTHAHTHVHTHTHTLLHTHTRTNTPSLVYPQTILNHTHTQTHTHTHTPLTHPLTHSHAHTLTYTHVHTHTLTHSLTSSGSTNVEGIALHFFGPGNFAVEKTVVARLEPRTELTLPVSEWVSEW